MERKKIAKGQDSFELLRQNNCYYVDKTSFIQTVFGDSEAVVHLITRPRRFGKTFTMKTFESFLAINPDNPGDTSKQQGLFEGTRILSDEGSPEEIASRKRFVRDFMGRYPVISLSLKNVDGLSFKLAYERFAGTIRMYADTIRYLLQSTKLDDMQKDELRDLLNIKYLRETDHSDALSSSLASIMRWLHLHYGVRPVVLIDEYDVPLAKAEANGYYPEMLDLLRSFLGALKSNNDLYKAVLTGCLRVSKESIFTGINHFSVNSILDASKPEYCSAIGFTKEETGEMLDYYDLGEYKSQVKSHYDGYRFGNTEMFCPWDVVSFCDDASSAKGHGITVLFKNSWTSTSGNEIIDEFADYIKPEHIDDMQALVDGKSIEVKVHESLNYPDLEQHEIDAFWTMLVYTGYLTLDKESSFNLSEPQKVRIPNLEIRECFSERILDHFKYNPQIKNSSIELARACLAGDADKVADGINRKLRGFISVKDLSSKSPYEDVYHSFLNGCFSSCGGVIADYASNREAGNGYADISFISDDSKIAVEIELKQSAEIVKMDALADAAVDQIEQKDYARDYIAQRGITAVYAYGICFCRKRCTVSMKKLK